VSDESRCPCGQTIAECDANEIEHLRARYDALQAKVSRESIDGLICDLDENEGWADDQVEAMQRLRDAILSDTSTEGERT